MIYGPIAAYPSRSIPSKNPLYVSVIALPYWKRSVGGLVPLIGVYICASTRISSRTVLSDDYCVHHIRRRQLAAARNAWHKNLERSRTTRRLPPAIDLLIGPGPSFFPMRRLRITSVLVTLCYVVAADPCLEHHVECVMLGNEITN